MIRISFIVIGLVTATAVGFAPEDHPLPTTDHRPTETVDSSHSTTFVRTDAINTTDQFHGVTRPSQQADLPPLVSGMIQQIHVEEGQFVRKGDALATLDDRVPRARLAAATVEANLTGALKRAQVQLRMAESRFRRVQGAVAQRAGADFEREAAEAERDSAQAAVEQQEGILQAAAADRELAEAQLAQFTITAPFDGVITEVHLKSGAVDPSMVVVSMANLSVLEVEMHVPSTMFGSMRVGELVGLNAMQPVSKNLTARVKSVSPILNSASETFRCLLQFDNSTSRLPAGFSVVLNGQTTPSVARQNQPGHSR